MRSKSTKVQKSIFREIHTISFVLVGARLSVEIEVVRRVLKWKAYAFADRCIRVLYQ